MKLAGGFSGGLDNACPATGRHANHRFAPTAATRAALKHQPKTCFDFSAGISRSNPAAKARHTKKLAMASHRQANDATSISGINREMYLEGEVDMKTVAMPITRNIVVWRAGVSPGRFLWFFSRAGNAMIVARLTNRIKEHPIADKFKTSPNVSPALKIFR